MIRGIAMKRKKKMGVDKETQNDTRQRMQKKDNAPCNNQLKRPTRKEDKKKVTFYQENCFLNSASKGTRKQQNLHHLRNN